VPVQGVHLRKKATLFGVPLILIMPVSGLHIDLDQIQNEAIPIIHTSFNIGVDFTPAFLRKTRKYQGCGSKSWNPILAAWVRVSVKTK
jgi:hypothetical protein